MVSCLRDDTPTRRDEACVFYLKFGISFPLEILIFLFFSIYTTCGEGGRGSVKVVLPIKHMDVNFLHVRWM